MNLMPGEALRAEIESFGAEGNVERPEKQVSNLSAFLDVFLPESGAQEAVENLLIDYVFNLCLAMAKRALMPDSAGDPETTCFKNIFQAFRLEESDARRLTRRAMDAARDAHRWPHRPRSVRRYRRQRWRRRRWCHRRARSLR